MTDVSQRIIADLLFARTGQQLSENRRWRITSALAGLLRDRSLTNLDQLVCLLADSREERLAQEVIEALLNNETYFFRDRIMFDLLASQVLPDLAAKRAGTRRLSIWSAGCSTGQEALSLSMLFADRPERWRGWKIDIVGTDISGRAIAAARAGLYNQFEIQRGLGVSQMLSWFAEAPQGWQPRPELRENLRFHQRNILDPAPDPGRFDLILCRNVLLYFAAANRNRVFGRLNEATASDGWLMIGAGETVPSTCAGFAPACDTSGLYRRTTTAPSRASAATGGR